jgi:hypothetical protein
MLQGIAATHTLVAGENEEIGIANAAFLDRIAKQ